jgi:hypothetical protein
MWTSLVVGCALAGMSSPQRDYAWGMADARAGLYVGVAGWASFGAGEWLQARARTGQAGSDAETDGLLLSVMGGIGIVSGEPLELVGATRAARSLSATGVPVSRFPATVGWMLFGGAVTVETIGLASADPATLEQTGHLTLLFLGGAQVAAFVQHGLVARAHAALPATADRRRPGADVAFAPMPGTAPGLAIVGTF